MSTAKKRIEELASVLADEQLEEAADFMAYLLIKEERALRDGLTRASESGLSFWDNSEDEVWDHV